MAQFFPFWEKIHTQHAKLSELMSLARAQREELYHQTRIIMALHLSISAGAGTAGPITLQTHPSGSDAQQNGKKIDSGADDDADNFFCYRFTSSTLYLTRKKVVEVLPTVLIGPEQLAVAERKLATDSFCTRTFLGLSWGWPNNFPNKGQVASSVFAHPPNKRDQSRRADLLAPSSSSFFTVRRRFRRARSD